ncbi:MAG: phospholipid/cholesterol/gamma-HCH transport system permease protein [Candidatus Tokpelaia sp. JSC161]|jgi:phospholipid/cholesterol/gamma-HCH transport system permease protein|nr:MAG: phospholipid/cholesterol/gamma-HCH transport system permease protein [Candidatus Tokpelaia sp. JSC161]
MVDNLEESLFDKTPFVKKRIENGVLKLDLNGDWNIHSIFLVDDEMRKLEECNFCEVVVMIEGISRFDISGGWLVERFCYTLRKKGINVDLQGFQNSSWMSLFHSAAQSIDDHHKIVSLKKRRFLSFVESMGFFTISYIQDFITVLSLIGSIFFRGVIGSRKNNFHGLMCPSIVSRVDMMGMKAAPITIFIAFFVGAILANQGAFQLRSFGADIFVADFVGILVFRELGVLLTAIIVAGRSGSAITAEIGSMKMHEEIDALKVMGVNPLTVIIVPILFALILIVPLLTILAEIAALAGAFMVLDIYSGITLDVFCRRIADAVQGSIYFYGLFKATVMALIIGMIASLEGLKVTRSAESLGKHVTSSVVKSIFFVIVFDGLLSICMR